jgi:hypothetical protein
MLKKFKLPALALGTALAIMSPSAALARDHDRDHERHEWREHERREHVWNERAPGYRGYYSYGPRYANGYYDRWGRWHPYGFYDRWGRWRTY